MTGVFVFIEHETCRRQFVPEIGNSRKQIGVDGKVGVRCIGGPRVSQRSTKVDGLCADENEGVYLIMHEKEGVQENSSGGYILGAETG